MHKKQINVGDLIEALKQEDPLNIVQLSIGEEFACLTHIFTSTDSGVTELTDYEDEDESLPHVVDALGNNVYVKDRILFYYDGIKKGIITNIKPINVIDAFNTKVYYVEYSISYSDKIITFATENNIDKTTNIVKFNW